MKKDLIKKYKKYKEILTLCKIVKIINYLDEQVETKIPTFKTDSKVKILTRF
ncbi:MAG: hypothetical protein IJY25_04130 [Bacilli bacterium]|nr:hypothetical protein [Bacilli bacterium]